MRVLRSVKYVREREMLYELTYIWNLKNEANKPKSKQTLKIQRTDVCLPGGGGADTGEGDECSCTIGKSGVCAQQKQHGNPFVWGQMVTRLMKVIVS